MRGAIRTSLALSILALVSGTASACPCLALEKDGEERAKAIFVGRVVEIEDIGSRHQRTTFAIRSAKKGPSSGTLQVVSESSRDTGCSARFEVGEEHLVYTHEHEYLDLDTFETVEVPHFTSACSRKKAPGAQGR